MTPVKSQKEQRSTKKPLAKKGWGSRIETAYLQVQARLRRRISLEEFGGMVAEKEGRSKGAYTKGAVSSWMSENGEPKIVTIEAIAAIAECEPWWIVWNVGKPPANVAESTAILEPKSKRTKAVS